MYQRLQQAALTGGKHMGVKKGLDALKKLTERDESTGEKAKWLKVEDGDKAKIYFLQEFDSSSPRYSATNGLAIAAEEHVHPTNFQVKALCTMDDEDRCYGCEQYRADYKDDSVPKEKKGRWRARARLYANVLVDPTGKEEDRYVAILSQGFGPKGVAEDIVNLALSAGAITDRSFTLSRKGTGRDTSWSLVPSLKEDAEFDPEAYEVYDLGKIAVREVAYEDQEEFFNADDSVVTNQAPTPPSTDWV
jgi:hypothetical protein